MTNPKNALRNRLIGFAKELPDDQRNILADILGKSGMCSMGGYCRAEGGCCACWARVVTPGNGDHLEAPVDANTTDDDAEQVDWVKALAACGDPADELAESLAKGYCAIIRQAQREGR